MNFFLPLCLMTFAPHTCVRSLYRRPLLSDDKCVIRCLSDSHKNGIFFLEKKREIGPPVNKCLDNFSIFFPFFWLPFCARGREEREQCDTHIAFGQLAFRLFRASKATWRSRPRGFYSLRIPDGQWSVLPSFNFFALKECSSGRLKGLSWRGPQYRSRSPQRHLPMEMSLIDNDILMLCALLSPPWTPGVWFSGTKRPTAKKSQPFGRLMDS